MTLFAARNKAEVLCQEKRRKLDEQKIRFSSYIHLWQKKKKAVDSGDVAKDDWVDDRSRKRRKLGEERKKERIISGETGAADFSSRDK